MGGAKIDLALMITHFNELPNISQTTEIKLQLRQAKLIG